MRHAPPRSVDVLDVRKRSVNDKCSLPTIIPQSAIFSGLIKARRAFKTGEWVAIFWMVYGVLETLYKKDMSVNDVTQLAAKGLNAAIQRDSASGSGFDIMTVTKEGLKKVAAKKLQFKVEL